MITKVKEGHFIVIKSQFIEKTTILSIYVPSNRASKYVKQKLTELQVETEKSTIAVGHFNIHLSIIYRVSRQKFSKDIGDMNNTINQPDLVTFINTPPHIAECMFFSKAYSTFTKGDRPYSEPYHKSQKIKKTPS